MNDKQSSLNPDAAENVYAEEQELNGALVGNVDTSVLRFNPGATPAVIEGTGIAVATTAENGTIATITKPGLYEVELELQVDGAVTVVAGVSKDAPAATLVADPTYAAAGIVKSKRTVSVAADTVVLDFTTLIRVSGAEAQAGCKIRFHGTDGAAGSPAGADVTNTKFRITRANGYAA